MQVARAEDKKASGVVVAHRLVVTTLQIGAGTLGPPRHQLGGSISYHISKVLCNTSCSGPSSRFHRPPSHSMHPRQPSSPLFRPRPR